MLPKGEEVAQTTIGDQGEKVDQTTDGDQELNETIAEFEGILFITAYSR